ncbi:hypothetical protein BBBOND_0404390 [Babesia bigemina]|uniref:6-Cys domain-containing protein n=1 Tax=Babesia bigemina TaxID=5866 RepID=A0A061DB84_BABBI|nr:hypothetical protein BBBOND_0404390 [Babesia bigemina]CDR97951.1 hypothetical protein BBBOND_0404390 [Babesia bigemina]|eukprot:XP_012770137.1 hypothetical protein BBBOND_0404390 [Babesia bigemina]
MVKPRMVSLLYCAIWMQWIGCLDALFCDLSDPEEPLGSHALVMCHMDIDKIEDAIGVCPRQVDDTEYVWHPQPTTDGHPHIETYVNDNGSLRARDFSDLVISENQASFISVESNQLQTKLHFNFPSHELFILTERRLIFICGPRDLVLSDTMQRHIYRLENSDQVEVMLWTSSTPLVEELKELRKGLGLFFVNIGHSHLLLQGCGSRTSPLFSPDNVVTEDSFTGTRSCVADPMSSLPIGFVCEGRIQPENCMKSLLDKNGYTVTAPSPHKYWHFDDHRPWVVAQYFDQLALPPFTGECRCVDSETGQVKARIEIRQKTEYTCDITSMIFRNRIRPIPGPWCSVVLHPGSTLTIKVPIQKVYRQSFDGSATVSFSQMMSLYDFETEFLPKDLMTLRQLQSIYDFETYDEIPYNQALVGDALALDVSQMNRGLVKLTYHSDKPLALKKGSSSFLYHLKLKSKNMNILERIDAAINLTFAFTHDYEVVGCDRESPSLFNPGISISNCLLKYMGNRIGLTYECRIRITRWRRKAGIHCRPDEELLPNNCESMVYDLYSNRAIELPTALQTTKQNIRGFQVLSFYFRNNSPFSYACICVDKHGYEKSKLVMENVQQEMYAYLVRRKQVSDSLRPTLLLPFSEIGLLFGGMKSQRFIGLYDINSISIKLTAGKTWSLNCGIDRESITFDDVENVATREDITATWLPKQPDIFYYTVNQTPVGPELVKVAYKDSIIISPNGLAVQYRELDMTPAYQIMVLQSNTSAIIISKDPLHKYFVPMTFVCGKAPNPWDLSVITDNASTSNDSARPSSHLLRPSIGYTWLVIDVSLKTTDPYMQGCGVTYSSTELFKPDTPKLYDAEGREIGCKIDIQTAKEAAFYCPAPYVLDPPECFNQVYVEDEVKNLSEISQSMIASASNHFVILNFDRELVGPGETLRPSPPLECRCVTVKGIVLSTIQIENYYSNE